jgi:hypothetical protein
MVNLYKQQPKKEERKIGNTTYTVTSHFRDKGCTAVDKVRRLIDMDTKAGTVNRKV